MQYPDYWEVPVEARYPVAAAAMSDDRSQQKWQMCLTEVMSSEAQQMWWYLVDSGMPHVGGMEQKRGEKKLWYTVADWIADLTYL